LPGSDEGTGRISGLMNLIIRLEIPLPEQIKDSETREQDLQSIVSYVRGECEIIVASTDIKTDYWLDGDE